MSITAISFVVFFLPVSLALYYVARDEVKEYILLVISLFFYACGSLECFVLFIISIVINVVLGRGIEHLKTDKMKSKACFIAGIGYNLFILGYYKYFNFGISIYGNIFKKDITGHLIGILPLGISFFTFKAISYLADVYTGKAVLSEKPVHDALYLSFFAQIQSGPLSRYNEMRGFQVNDSSRAKLVYFSEGVFRFLIGFNKKVVLANVLSNVTTEIFNANFENVSTGYLWLGSICYSLQLLFDFSGYSDMAIGISEMFGYKCTENFNYPYMTPSVSKFWRRWHISLGSWFRDYVYIPMGGARCEKSWRIYLNLFVVWILTGVWHGASKNFIFWGFAYFVLIAFEKKTLLPDRIRSKIGKGIYRILTLLFINFQWVIFNASSLTSGLQYIKRMLIYTPNALADKRTLFLIGDYKFFMIAAIVLCFPIVSWIDEKLKDKKILHNIYEIALALIVVVTGIWAFSFVIAGQNNPFAYANF